MYGETGGNPLTMLHKKNITLQIITVFVDNNCWLVLHCYSVLKFISNVSWLWNILGAFENVLLRHQE